MKKILLIIFFIFISSSLAFSQEEKTIENLYIDLSPPDVSAFKFLKDKPEKIFENGTVDELTAQILNLYDATKKTINPGYGFDWAPYITFVPDWYKNYEPSVLEQMARKIQVSLGTLKDSSGINVGYSFQWTHINKTDPANEEDVFSKLHRYNLIVNTEQEVMIKYSELVSQIARFADQKGIKTKFSILKDELKSSFPRNSDYEKDNEKLITRLLEFLKKKKSDINISRDEVSQFMEHYIQLNDKLENNDSILNLEAKNYLDSFAIKNWNKTKLTVGLGGLAISGDGSVKQLKGKKVAGFVTLSIPLDFIAVNKFQLTGQWMYNYFFSDKEEINNSIGGRLIYGSDNIRLYGEALYTRKHTAENNQNLRTTFGFEYKLGDIWIALAAGSDKPFEDYGNSSIVSLFDVKYAFRSAKRKFK